MRANVSLECSYWSCIKSHCYFPIQQRTRWGGKKGWPNVMVTTCSIVKGSFIDQDRKGEGRYFCRTPTVWHFRKAVLSVLSHLIVTHKEHRCLDWGNLSCGLRTQQRQTAGLHVASQSRESCSLYLSVVISQFACCVLWEGGLSFVLASCFDILKALLSNLISNLSETHCRWRHWFG